MVKVRNTLLILISVYFLFNGFKSANLGSIVVAIILAGICFYVVITGKVHRKFAKAEETKKTFVPASSDEAIKNIFEKNMTELFGEDLVLNVKNRLASHSEKAD